MLPGLGLEAPPGAVAPAPPSSSSVPSGSVPRVKRFDALIIGASLAVVIALLVVIFKPFQSAGEASSSALVASPPTSTPLTASPSVPTTVPEPLTSSGTPPAPDSTTPTPNAAGVPPDPGATPTTVSSTAPQPPTDPELEREAIRDFLVRWNELYKTALETNDERGLLPFIDGDQRTGLITRFAERRRDRCILSIEERRAFQQGDVLLASALNAKTSITRDVAYVERCAGKEARIVRDGQDVNVEYTLEKRGGAWIILGSVTTGGAIKVIAKPAAPKNPVLTKVDCNGEPFLIAGRENVECSATFVYTPNANNALLSVEGQVLIDKIRDGLSNKSVASGVYASKDLGTLLFAPLKDGRIEIIVPWSISISANTFNVYQSRARAKLKFNFTDDSAYRPADLVLEIK